jgi:hypothetical protein
MMGRHFTPACNAAPLLPVPLCGLVSTSGGRCACRWSVPSSSYAGNPSEAYRQPFVGLDPPSAAGAAHSFHTLANVVGRGVAAAKWDCETPTLVLLCVHRISCVVGRGPPFSGLNLVLQCLSAACV